MKSRKNEETLRASNDFRFTNELTIMRMQMLRVILFGRLGDFELLFLGFSIDSVHNVLVGVRNSLFLGMIVEPRGQRVEVAAGMHMLADERVASLTRVVDDTLQKFFRDAARSSNVPIVKVHYEIRV